jgi:glutaminase
MIDFDDWYMLRSSLIEAKDGAQRWEIIKTNMDDFATRKLDFNEKIDQSEVNDNKRGQAISKLLDANARMHSAPLESTTIHAKQCSVNIPDHDLAVMGSTPANHGINPISNNKMIDPLLPQHILAV